jgi:DnaD/phage-associated family protein
MRFTPVPDPFFTELLALIDNLGELKVTLYSLWRLNRMEGKFRYLWEEDFLNDEGLMAGFDHNAEKARKAISDGLLKVVERGTLLKNEISSEGSKRTVYFLNSQRGRAAMKAIQSGDWKPELDPQPPRELLAEPPNIFRLYEENFGPLTPIIAEALKEAEASYPATWIEEAIHIAIGNNVRRWRYVEAILRSWQEEGKDERGFQGDSEEDRHRYIRGKYSDFIEH